MSRKRSITIREIVHGGDPYITWPSSVIKRPNDLVIKDTEITIEFDYPLGAPVFKTYKSKTGFTRQLLFEKIQSGYLKIYYKPDKYGIWGHGIDDLALEGVQIKDAKVTLSIGS